MAHMNIVKSFEVEGHFVQVTDVGKTIVMTSEGDELFRLNGGDVLAVSEALRVYYIGHDHGNASGRVGLQFELRRLLGAVGEVAP